MASSGARWSDTQPHAESAATRIITKNGRRALAAMTLAMIPAARAEG